MLAEAGARLDGTRARIPAAMVDAALQSAPRRFVLKARGADGGGHGHARRGEAGGLELVDGRSYFGTGSDCVYVTDPDTGERRQTVTADVEGMAALADRLPNIDFVMSMGLPSDVPAQVGDLAQFAAMLAGTGKPLLTTAHDALSLRRMRDMAALCGEARSFGCYAMPNPPLVHSAEALDKVQACAELEIPLVYAPAPAAGTTAPSSIAATIVVGNAETLSGLVVHQLTNARRAVRVRRRLRRLRHAHRRSTCTARPSTSSATPPPPTWPASTACRASPTRPSPTPRRSTSSGPPRPASPRCSAPSAAPRCCTTSATSRAACRAPTRPSSSATSSSGYARALLVEVGVDDESLALNEIDAVGPGGSHLGRDYTRQHHRDFWQPACSTAPPTSAGTRPAPRRSRSAWSAQTQALREAPRAFTLEASIRERLQRGARRGRSELPMTEPDATAGAVRPPRPSRSCTRRRASR